MHSCCCLKHDYCKPKCHNLHNVQLISVSVLKTAQTSFIIFLHARIMVDGAKFNSHDSDSHFKKLTFNLKMAAERKIQISL